MDGTFEGICKRFNNFFDWIKFKQHSGHEVECFYLAHNQNDGPWKLEIFSKMGTANSQDLAFKMSLFPDESHKKSKIFFNEKTIPFNVKDINGFDYSDGEMTFTVSDILYEALKENGFPMDKGLPLNDDAEPLGEGDEPKGYVRFIKTEPDEQTQVSDEDYGKLTSEELYRILDEWFISEPTGNELVDEAGEHMDEDDAPEGDFDPDTLPGGNDNNGQSSHEVAMELIDLALESAVEDDDEVLPGNIDEPSYYDVKHVLVNGRVFIHDDQLRDGKIFGVDGERLKGTAVNTLLAEQLKKLKEDYAFGESVDLKVVVFLENGDADELEMLKQYCADSVPFIDAWIIGRDMHEVYERLGEAGIERENVVGVVNENRLGGTRFDDKDDVFQVLVLEKRLIDVARYRLLDPSQIDIFEEIFGEAADGIRTYQRKKGSVFRQMPTFTEIVNTFFDEDYNQAGGESGLRPFVDPKVIVLPEAEADSVRSFTESIRSYNNSFNTAA